MYRGVSPTSQIRAEVRLKSGHSFWAKYREGNDVIDLHGPFSDYWSSTNYEFTALSQSSSPISPRLASDRRTENIVIGKHSGILEVRFSSDDTVRICSIAHPSQLLIFV